MNMKFTVIIKAVIATAILLFTSNVFSEDVKQGDKIKIITPETLARFCPYPNCGSNQNITRIPEGTTLEVEGIQTVKSGLMTVKWFEVTFRDRKGWVSIYDTNKQ